MKYLASLLFFICIPAAETEGFKQTWWPDERGAPCTTKTDREELGDECGRLEVRKPKIWRKNAIRDKK